MAKNQYLGIWTLCFATISVFGCGSENQNSAHWPRQGTEIEIYYSWGYESRNRIDTISGTLTKNLLADGTITVPFELSGKQKKEIVAYADSIIFWYWPDALYVPPPPPDGLSSSKSPCKKQVLQIQRSHGTKTVVWDDCLVNTTQPSPLLDIVKPLGELIENMVEGSETYKDLPRSRGSVY
jgi:hypothetical protein